MTPTDPIQEIINKSGNNLHSQVVTFLRENGWAVMVSPYYNYNQTNKAREIDVIAEKEIPIHQFRKERDCTLNIKLFIECKYINNEVVFWFDNKDIDTAEEMITKTTVLKPYAENRSIEKHHHFENNKVAKLFASNSNKLNENEDFYKALNQTLNGMVYHRRHHRSLIKGNSQRRNSFQHEVYYPIILCNNFDNLYRTEYSGSAKSDKKMG
jgi:hypothetical protein